HPGDLKRLRLLDHALLPFPSADDDVDVTWISDAHHACQGVVELPFSYVDGNVIGNELLPYLRFENRLVRGQQIEVERESRIAARSHGHGADHRVPNALRVENAFDPLNHRRRRPA